MLAELEKAVEKSYNDTIIVATAEMKKLKNVIY